MTGLEPVTSSNLQLLQVRRKHATNCVTSPRLALCLLKLLGVFGDICANRLAEMCFWIVS
jgi:hypothetical protein